MGYTAYRAWTTGATSFNPETVALAKVCTYTSSPYSSICGPFILCTYLRRLFFPLLYCTVSSPTNPSQQGATLYTIQLGLNLVWMPLFFGYGKPAAATADIVALTGTVGYLAYIWGQVDPVCGWLLAPYLAWLSFATYLSVS
jgi:benzodiazapine receptor